jgi:hypothetical protein
MELELAFADRRKMELSQRQRDRDLPDYPGVYVDPKTKNRQIFGADTETNYMGKFDLIVEAGLNARSRRSFVPQKVCIIFFHLLGNLFSFSILILF